ncbi:MAG TPA: Gfo/Idh/MocA family oxidoreductase [Chthoniobacterales bacterium]|nr:Gfo/Idh/MocA family oxidoreductase [Chthoniobacterales bacterium]
MLRGAIVGFGNVAQFGHWPGYVASDEVEIVAVVDASAARRQSAASLRPSLDLFASLGEIDRSAIDFVDICTPPAQHAEPMQKAIEQGWHVLCEKPFLLDPALLERMRALAADRSVAVLPVHNWKYAPIIRAATAQLRAGAIGQLQRVEIATLRRQDAASADQTQPNWRRDPAISGGGILMDHGWHALYLAQHWFDGTPRAIRSELHRPGAGLAEDEAILELEFAAGSARIELSWTARQRSNRLRLAGSGGEMMLADDILRVNNEETRFEPALSAGSHHADWFAAMLPDVLAAFRQPELSRPSFDEAAACLEMIQHAYATASWRSSALPIIQ